VTGLLTDLYELIMAAGYFECRQSQTKSHFRTFHPQAPPSPQFRDRFRLAQCVDYLLNVRFTQEEIDYLRGLPQFAGVSLRILRLSA
jgi:nicotinate phosphoribosyltransferase